MKEKIMKKVLDVAKNSSPKESPIAAAILQDGKIISLASNTKEQDMDPSAHAEINAIRLAAKKLNTWRLNDCEIYISLEPCLMCAGAIIQARIKKVYFAAYDLKGGAVCSSANAFDTKGLNHRPEWEGGLLKDIASKNLSDFFKNLRETKCK